MVSPEPVLFQAGQRVPAGAKTAPRKPFNSLPATPIPASFLNISLPPSRKTQGHKLPRLQPTLSGNITSPPSSSLPSPGPVRGSPPEKESRIHFKFTISVLIVSCPCALGLALPLLDEILLSKMKRQGIFIRRHSLWNRLKKVTLLDFDKTGEA